MDNENNYERFNASIDQGLTNEQAELRVKQKLVNKSQQAFGKTYTEIIVSNVFSFFNVLLYVIAGVMICFRLFTGMFFVIVLLSNTIVGLCEDIKARKLLSKLRLITQPKATVIRDGQQIEIPVEEVVLDDIIYIEKDTQICAGTV